MWRKLLFVVLLVGIGYLIWRRMQSGTEALPSFAPPPGKPATPQSTLPTSSSAEGGPRPVVTRVHRGAPPPPTPTSAAPSGTSTSGPRPVVTRVHRGAPPEPRRRPMSTGETMVNRNGTGESSSDQVSSAPVLSEVSPPLSEVPSSATLVTQVREPEAAVPSAPAASAAAVREPEAAVPSAPAASAAAVREPEAAVPSAPAASAAAAAPATPDTRSEEEEIAALIEASAAVEFVPVDINRADRATLITLPGIGPVLADRIIAYREAHGPFKSVDDLIAVSGIGERNINAFRKLVYVTHD
ncbi:ComEA family DNA-binding protein [Chloroflexus aggregans]|uniref:Helix-hairpin-helix motif protein n=1 Tax=Chloroflexus aggregans (strain MD-66 / DSM 9485) TaxID=326427 RepID=B8G419_CHLAD|nr:helix-hairpin-helix domain-containing protein [Chloroflexus aggregans]ACL25421.1 helix-hairpin-helix motif protein [Chloroflexus aggregans DSM 9485]